MATSMGRRPLVAAAALLVLLTGCRGASPDEPKSTYARQQDGLDCPDDTTVGAAMDPAEGAKGVRGTPKEVAEKYAKRQFDDFGGVVQIEPQGGEPRVAVLRGDGTRQAIVSLFEIQPGAWFVDGLERCGK
jgi:hypothetical protein